MAITTENRAKQKSVLPSVRTWRLLLCDQVSELDKCTQVGTHQIKLHHFWLLRPGVTNLSLVDF